VVFSGYSGFLHQKKNDRPDITEILLKVALNTINLTHYILKDYTVSFKDLYKLMF